MTVKKTMKIVAVTLLCALALSALGGFLFTYLGAYDIAARTPHPKLEFNLLQFVQRRSVKVRAQREMKEVPALDDPAMLRRGFLMYRKHCVMCHGAPGESRTRVGVGVNPSPPPLEQTVRDWSAAELYWIIANGIKMAGMPAFNLGVASQGLWDITAFVVRLNTLTPAEYRRMVQVSEGALPAREVSWTAPQDQGWKTLEKRGSRAQGRRLIRRLGCVTCHEVSELPVARGTVGPPLSHWRRRHYIAGHFLNVPTQLVRWVQNPRSLKPGTAMPDLRVSEEQAWHLASYLYSLE